MSSSHWSFCLILAFLLAVEAASGEATKFKYQNPPLYVHLGECVNFTAQSYFSVIRRSMPGVQITWKKDTHVFANEPAWFYISYSKFSDAAFYQVEIKNISSNIIEETLFWLNVQACNQNEKESPETTAKCKSSCVEVCPSGWSYLKSPNGDRCYKYYGEPKTWLAAQDACQTVGAELAVAGIMEENRFIGSLIKSAAGVWIGLNDRISESRYVWNNAKSSSLKYTSWAENEPNNYNAKCNIENCVVMSRNDGKWADVICNAFYSFICETPWTNVSGWSCFNLKCYRFFDRQVMWHEAKATCKANGATLVSIDSQNENDVILKMINTDIWIGLNDIAEAGAFVWNKVTYSSQRPSFTNWASNEPNDMVFDRSFATKCDGEDCVVLKEWQSQTLWFDNDCSSKKPYVCEKIRDSLLSLGMLIGIIVGSLIVVAVGAGVINSAIKKRNREQLKSVIINALERDYSEMLRQEGNTPFRTNRQPVKRR